MPSRKLYELASDVDDAIATVEELKSDPDTDTNEKLDEVHEILDKASDTITGSWITTSLAPCC